MRLIVDGPAPGAWNMAVDRAILASHEAVEGIATLRLYRWEPATVSLGRFQKLDDVDLAVCRRAGLGLCRRPTGGRGVLHADEITYSIVAGLRDGVPRGVSASYRMLCGALVEAYREIGVPAELTARPRGLQASGACYLHATHADLSLGAAKLSGSAQVWGHESCLQHGSFVIDRDVALEAAVFRLSADSEEALAGSTDTISGALGIRPDLAELTEAIVRGVAHGMDVTLEPGALTQGEREWAERHVAESVVEGYEQG